MIWSWLASCLISRNFLEGAKEAGFSHFEVIGRDPRVLPMRISKRHDIPYHHFFVYKDYLIQLVIFYLRNDSYFWHGKIDWSQVSQTGSWMTKQWSHDQKLYGNRGEGAYDKMEFAEVKVDNVYFMVPKYPKKFLNQIQHSTFLECNYERAAKFVTRHYDDGDVVGERFRSNAKDILIAGAAVLDELGIPFWLSSGTCLSWFRECRIIGHSLDVDFGMKIEDYSVRLIPAMEMAGLMLVHQFGKRSDSYELSFVKDQLKLDIFFFYEEGNTLWNGGSDTSTGEKYKYIFPWFDLCWTEFIGIKVRVPCQTLSYVEANYGKSWNTKVTSWNWKSSPPNVIPNGQWPKEEWPEVMQVFEIIEVEES
ncbi:putative fukutin-like [Apostichopus japonicus]|uniref:Putative fukutin-like n=1 Tax=Stichopus japonicus TaxID=307972 RepID=A0A2G8LH29_STIJA|nr:putative fukutin-like [Apostichopus japonicus]